uniref:G_PROTEIN_RECEP_F1_2 domain-containing protein n=1 Tax=Angiostrongylus cantonensis TaxID=6313 RepID=A0A0K0DB87_ANGCA
LFQFLEPFTSVFSQIHSYLYVFLCVVGVFANVAIIVVLLRPAMRRSPFNLFLICIAICDATLMATYLLYKHVEMCHPWFFTHAWMIYTRFYAMFSVFVHSASLWITVNMAVMRYLVLFRGSHPHSRLPPCNGYPAACIAIVIGVVIAFIGSLPNMFRYRIEFVVEMEVPKICFQTKYKSSWFATDTIYKYDLSQPSWWNCHWERVNFWMAGTFQNILSIFIGTRCTALPIFSTMTFTACVLKLVPCVLLTVFMTLLVRMLIEARERRLRLSGGVATGNSQAERTTAMLTGIVAVFLVTELPQGILGLAVGVNPRLMFITNPLGNFFDLLSLINSAVNFVLCALMSHVFRREFLRTFRMCCPQSSENHSGAPITKSSDKKVPNCSV